jgi:hypothetical protein
MNYRIAIVESIAVFNPKKKNHKYQQLNELQLNPEIAANQID